MPVALLCTYAVSPGKTLESMRDAVESHGGKVLVGAAVSRKTARGHGTAPEIRNLVAGVMALA